MAMLYILDSIYISKESEVVPCHAPPASKGMRLCPVQFPFIEYGFSGDDVKNHAAY